MHISRVSSPSAPFLAAFESTYQPAHDVDVAETNGHAEHWRADLETALGPGVTCLRYPLRWHRIEPEPGCFDFAETDAVLGELHDRGADPVVDLLHHTSYPGWLTGGFRDRRFRDAYVRFAAAVAGRYPWLRSYTLVNEPFATLFLAGHEALWPPYDRGVEGFARLLGNVLPAVAEASRCWTDLLPRARHVWVDTGEHHGGAGGPAAGSMSDLETAHRRGVGAAAAGLQDAALGATRLTGPGVTGLAEAAVTSATPFVRAPLLARISAALLLHPPEGDPEGGCPTCGTSAPCETARVLRW